LLAHPRLLGTLLAALVGLLCACGGSEEAGQDGSRPSRFLSLDPKPIPSAPDAVVARRYQRLSPSPDRPWDVNRARAKYVPLEESAEAGGEYSLRLVQNEHPTILIPGPFDGSAFNSVALKVRLGRPRELVLQFLSEGEWVRTSREIEPRLGEQLRIIELDSPELSRLEGEVEHLRVSILGETQYVRLDWIDLIEKSCGSFFPDPASAPAMVGIQEDLRRSVGVSTERPVAVHFEAPERGSLHFAIGHAPRWRGEWQGASVRLVLTGPHGELARHEYPIETGTEPPWQAVRLPLAAPRGQTLEARWEIVADGEVACPLAEVGVLTEGTGPRHVLLITSDTHRSDHLGVAGRGVVVRTPALDALAERGILFEDCFSSTNVTNPSHVALMTATHPRDTGIIDNAQRMNESAPTLAEAFQRAGFRTYAVISSLHLGDVVCGLGQGFDRMSTPGLDDTRDGTDTVDVLVDWVGEAEGLPLFIWLHLFDAHIPYEPPPDIAAEYYPEKALAFDPARPAIEEIPPRLYWRRFPGLKDLEYPSAMYRGEVTHLDAELQRVFGLPGMDQAIIGFTADHGESLGEHGIYFSHTDLYPESIHVPLVLSFPGGPSGVRCSSPVQHIDLGRTLLDLAGSAGVEFPGANLLSALDVEEGAGEPRFALACYRLEASMTERGWHLIFRLGEGANANRLNERVRHAVEFYYLPDDPGCLDNRLEREPARAKRMRQSVIDWLARAEDRGWLGETITDAATLRNLEALGYAGEGEVSAPVGELYDSSCECEWCARFE